MNRRLFTQLMALVAGSTGLLAAEARGAEDGAASAGDASRRERSKSPRPGDARPLEAVCVKDFKALAKAKLPPARPTSAQRCSLRGSASNCSATSCCDSGRRSHQTF
ncbi:MAG TPA: hypothetical protein VMV10_23955 [Pirellulales bacterium]|nr:hypothetical protein [Pirellulales bacterium]